MEARSKQFLVNENDSDDFIMQIHNYFRISILVNEYIEEAMCDLFTKEN